MSWALIDDQSTFHSKVVAAGNAAWGACVRMIAWSMSHLTDGCVPMHVAKLIANDEEFASLARAGLIKVTAESVHIHDFLEWNKSAKQIRKERAAKVKAGKNGGLASGKRRKQAWSRIKAPAEAPASSLVAPPPNSSSSPLLSSPDQEKIPEMGSAPPTPPQAPPGDRKEPKSGTRPKANRPVETQLPEDWTPPPSFWAWVAKKRYARGDVERCLEAMTLWARSNAARKVDWVAALQGWINREASAGRVGQQQDSVLPFTKRDVPTPEELANADQAAVKASLAAAREALQRFRTEPPPEDNAPDVAAVMP